ncbi:unnamed protein product [Orchesella dallaii]|uniref:Uncharacterized protein n=1 Tax=Orchesella dallaii TaxID=48710 RepID=A0ABP1R121_9HEXA
MMWKIVVSTLFLLLTTNLEVEAQHYRYSDLFFHDNYFLGAPPSMDEVFEPYVRPTKDIPPEEILEIPISDKTGDTDEPPTFDFTWPGTDFDVTDPGSEVVKVYKENLKTRMEQVSSDSSSTSSDTGISGRSNTCEARQKSCLTIPSFSVREVCTIQCLVKESNLFKDLPFILQKCLKYFCRTSNTFFMRLNEFKIKTWEDYKSIMQAAVPRTITTVQAALRAMLVKLIMEVNSPLTRLRPLFEQFNEIVKPTYNKLGLKNDVLIGNNPGCAMVNMDEPIEKMIILINKDNSLLDYIVFQGYSLCTSVAKYVPDFQFKKMFVSVNSILDMLIGTTCGLHKYGMTGETSDCDQMGGYPTLDMPLPNSIWKPKTQKACETVKNTYLYGRAEDLPADMGPDEADAVDDEAMGGGGGQNKMVRKKRLTLKVGARLGGGVKDKTDSV